MALLESFCRPGRPAKRHRLGENIVRRCERSAIIFANMPRDCVKHFECSPPQIDKNKGESRGFLARSSCRLVVQWPQGDGACHLENSLTEKPRCEQQRTQKKYGIYCGQLSHLGPRGVAYAFRRAAQSALRCFLRSLSHPSPTSKKYPPFLVLS